jgi:hypothetical protein
MGFLGHRTSPLKMLVCFYNNMTEVVTYNSSDFCLMFTDIPDYDYGEEGSGEEKTESLHETYSVCYKEEEREEVDKQRIFKGIFYPTAIHF